MSSFRNETGDFDAKEDAGKGTKKKQLRKIFTRKLLMIDTKYINIVNL